MAIQRRKQRRMHGKGSMPLPKEKSAHIIDVTVLIRNGGRAAHIAWPEQLLEYVHVYTPFAAIEYRNPRWLLVHLAANLLVVAVGRSIIYLIAKEWSVWAPS